MSGILINNCASTRLDKLHGAEFVRWARQVARDEFKIALGFVPLEKVREIRDTLINEKQLTGINHEKAFLALFQLQCVWLSMMKTLDRGTVEQMMRGAFEDAVNDKGDLW